MTELTAVNRIVLQEEAKIMKRIKILFVFVALSIFLTSCAPATEPKSTQTEGQKKELTVEESSKTENTVKEKNNVKDSLTIALPDAPSYMDPMVQASIGTFRVTTQMFDRLVQLDNDMNLVPSLAESWDVLDDKTIVFHLRKDVKFHNGEPLKSDDVKYSLERCIKSDGVNYNYLIIDKIEIPDDYTVKITTKKPFNALLYRLTLDAASIVSKKAAESGEDFNKHPVGAGPYRFVSWEVGGDIVLEAFEDYYKGAPKTKKLIFKHIPEAINRTIGLETDTVDIAYDLSVTDIDTVKANDNLKMMDVLSNTVWYVGFNCTKKPFDDVKVRQAIAYAINVDDVINIAFGGIASPANGSMIPPKVDYHMDKPVDYKQNIEQAKELLSEAGFPDGFQTTLWCSDSQIMRDISVVIQDLLRKIGVDVKIKSMEQGAYYSATGKGEHEMFIMSKTSIDPDSMLRAMYHTEAFGLSGNRSFWAMPELDELIDKAATSIDTEEVAKLYKEIQIKAAENVPLIPLCVEHLNAGMKKEVEGFGLYPGKSHYIYDAFSSKP